MVDSSNVVPNRYWIAYPDRHPVLKFCSSCGELLTTDHAIPMTQFGPVCWKCATTAISDSPITVEYADWLQAGDLRWWSPWLCNCPECLIYEKVFRDRI